MRALARLVGVAWFCGWLLFGVAPALGMQAAGQGSVDPFFGSFSTEVPIQVPPYHGIEPALKLVYSSTSGDGFVGVGWSLAGLSTVQRASPGKGSPRYDASDVFLLDGAELLSCTAQGGTHCTMIQNYTRIVRDAQANSWTVWGTTGNQMTYEPVFETPAGTFRWAVTRLEDPHGNAVDYEYTCISSTQTGETLDCYPKRVHYNGNEIRFFRESRPGRIWFATGAGIGKTKHRLAAIRVQVDGETARAYELDYSDSPYTNRSVLERVQLHGRGAVVDAANNVSGSDALPAMEFDVQAGPASGGYGWGASGDPLLLEGMPDDYVSGDVDGDGRVDFMGATGGGLPTCPSTTVWTILSDPDGDFEIVEDEHAQCVPLTGKQFAADVNGDGLADLVSVNEPNVYAPGVQIAQAISRGDGTYDLATHLMPYSHAAIQGDWAAADVNGDGRSDLLGLDESTLTDDVIYVGLSNGDGSFDFSSIDRPWLATPGGWNLVGDWNGDGRADIARLDLTAGDRVFYRTLISNGDGTFEYAQQVGDWSWQAGAIWFAGDPNGDGHSDLMTVRLSSGQARLGVAFSHGNGQFTELDEDTGWDVAGGILGAGGDWFVADANGDGRTDFMMVRKMTQQPWLRLRTALSNSDGSFELAEQVDNFDYKDGYTFSVGDQDGDGKSDFLALPVEAGRHSSLAKVHWAGSTNAFDLVATVRNGVGGTTAVDYIPSSEWTNTLLPQGLVLQTVRSITTDDGRGNASTTDYAYQGGLWSWTERRFLGFRRVTGWPDAQGHYTETYYHQHEGCISKPEDTYFRDAAGKIVHASHYEYESGANPAMPPYISLLASRYDYECNGQTSLEDCRTILTSFAYDEFGNGTHTYEYGEYDAANPQGEGDERTTVRTYAPNLADYVVALPSSEAVWGGIWADTSQAGPPARLTQYAYDAQASSDDPPLQGNLTRISRWDSEGPPDSYAVTERSYDAYGNLVSEIDPRGTEQTWQYDSVHRVYATQNCIAPQTLNHCRDHSWDYVAGQRASTTGLNGEVTSYVYDVLGRPLEIHHPNLAVTRFEYSSLGDPNAQRRRKLVPDGSAEGLWVDEYQDGLGRVYKTVRKPDLVQVVDYDGASQRKQQESLWHRSGETPRYQSFQYDGAGRLTQVTNPDGSYSTIVHRIGLQKTFDEMGHVKKAWKDGLGRVIQLAEKDNGVNFYTNFEYDAQNQLVQAMDDDGNASTFVWDSLGRKTSSCDVDLGCWSYEYDAGGLLTAQVDAKSQRIELGYDELGRIVSKELPGGSETQWFYDEAGFGASLGQLTRVVYLGGSEAHHWDVMGRKPQEDRCVGGLCKTTLREFELDGRVAALTYPDGERVDYTYDESGRVASVSGYVDEMDWTASGRLERILYANGVESSFDYDADREWMDAARVEGPAGQLLYDASYAYDVAARVASVASSTNPFSSMNYGYDELDRLVSASGIRPDGFTYDALGNITQKDSLGILLYNDPAHRHAVSTVGDNRYSYDDNGNLVVVKRDSGGCGGSVVKKTFSWDAENRLAAAWNDGDAFSFSYDADGLRIEASGPEGVTRYFGALAEDRDGQLVKHYYVGRILVSTQDAAGTIWIHQDHLDSVRLVTDATGADIAGQDFDSFGKILGGSGASINRRGFGGHHQDAALGLVYMGARYYDPELGRFISPDPIVPDEGNPQALNRYAFVYNNPISNVDPSGHAPVVAAVITATAVGSAPGVATWVVAVSTIGAAATVAGYALENSALMTLGSIMLGFSSGYASVAGGSLTHGLIGAGVAAASSPLSPLDPTVKMVVGWAYSAYGWIRDPQAPETQRNFSEGTSPSIEASGAQRATDAPDVATGSLADLDPSEVRRIVIENFHDAALRAAESNKTVSVSVGDLAKGLPEKDPLIEKLVALKGDITLSAKKLDNGVLKGSFRRVGETTDIPTDYFEIKIGGKLDGRFQSTAFSITITDYAGISARKGYFPIPLPGTISVTPGGIDF